MSKKSKSILITIIGLTMFFNLYQPNLTQAHEMGNAQVRWIINLHPVTI